MNNNINNPVIISVRILQKADKGFKKTDAAT